MSIHTRYLKTKPVCKVTFKIPDTVGNGVAKAHLVGEFNQWSTAATPMKRLKNGAFTATVDLVTNRSYQFRYLLGHSRWENDPEADGHVPTPYGDSHNSVIDL
jgi:1,4-alpha-glucan branching enzyme